MHNGARMKTRLSSADTLRGLCRRIEALVEASAESKALDLSSLARTAGLSPWHLQRSFKAALGISPRDYAEACRLKALKRGLHTQASVTEAIHAAGYGSGSRVYERTDSRLGMTPGEYRKGGESTQISWVIQTIPHGLLMLAATDRGLCSVQLGDSATGLQQALAQEFPRATLKAATARGNTRLRDWMRALRAHLREGLPLPELPLDIRGTAFQMKVWQYLAHIPRGETRTYTEVAQAIGHAGAVRAVGSACAGNRIALLIPCHRVIRGDGSLGGYRWGLPRKAALLAAERASAAGTGTGTGTGTGRKKRP